MDNFKIRRGLSTTVFISPGVINPRLLIEEGCWYLCTDTAELFLGVVDSLEGLTLKRINGNTPVNSNPDDSNNNSDITENINNIELLIKELSEKVVALDDVELFQKIDSEADLPTDFESENFNPNVTYYIQLPGNNISTFVFDKGAQSYMCTNSVDELLVRAMVSEAIDITLDSALTSKLPQVIKQTIEATILHGGDATPGD